VFLRIALGDFTKLWEAWVFITRIWNEGVNARKCPNLNKLENEKKRFYKEERGKKMPALFEHDHGCIDTCDFQRRNVPKILNYFKAYER